MKSLIRFKTTYGILELFQNNEMLYTADDNKTLAQTDGRDRIVRKTIVSIRRECYLVVFRQSVFDGFNIRHKLVQVVKVVHQNRK